MFHTVKVWPSATILAKEDQLAWKLAGVALNEAPINDKVTDMVINRIIDNTGVALACLNRRPVVAARQQALAHARVGGAGVFGAGITAPVAAEWAAWANGVAVRELDFHDTFLAADYAHPADSIPALMAVAEQCGASGKALIHAIAVSYEVHVNLVKAICLHEYKIDHIAHLAPAIAVGIGALLRLDQDTIYQAVQQSLHVSCSTRQSRKGMISSWKAFAPAHAGKLAIEAIDRAMRGEGAPSPIYEGEDSVVARMLGGPNSVYDVYLPCMDEPLSAILETYTKAYSAEYQSQALIDLAFRMREKIEGLDRIDQITIQTSHHTHNVIGTGAGDPEKFDPSASRETLDHSIMYIFAVALEDGFWHYEKSYPPERPVTEATLTLWRKISTEETPEWTRRYHANDPAHKAFGGRVVIRMNDGREFADEQAVAAAHPLGQAPYARADYKAKFRALCQDILPLSGQQNFLAAAEGLEDLLPCEIGALVPSVPKHLLVRSAARGIFDA